MPRKDNREIRALLEEALTCEAQNPELYSHLLVSLGVNQNQKPTHAQLIVAQLVQKGIEGDMKAIQEILDRLLGKSVQHTEVKTQVNYSDFLLSLVDEREKKELGIVIDTTAEPVEDLIPPQRALPFPAKAPAAKPVDPLSDLL